MLFITHALPKGLLNEQPRSKLRGIEHPSLNSFRGKPRGIEPEEIDEVIQIGGGQGSDRLSVVSGTFEQRPKGIL